MATIIDLARSLGGLDPSKLRIDEMRAQYEMAVAAYPVPEDVKLEAREAGGVPAEWVRAAGCSYERVVEYLHGGGYVIGGLATHRELASRLSRSTGASVLVVDYRLAPEHPFPAALDDAVAAYRWLLAEGFDASSVALAGDSAGGGLVVATLIALRDANSPLPAAAVCLSPWADLTQSGDSVTTRAEIDPITSKAALDAMAAWYLGDHDPRDPLASPLFGDLAGLPPLLVQVGELEVLYDDAARLAERARDAGVSVHAAHIVGRRAA